jgi:hypothetical protein
MEAWYRQHQFAIAQVKQPQQLASKNYQLPKELASLISSL